MKSTLTAMLALSRPTSPQAALRLFAAGSSPRIPETLRYLTHPHYRLITFAGAPRAATFAGDGRLFLWTYTRIPGFTDATVPPAGFPYVDVPAILALKRGFPQVPCPQPLGPWTAGAVTDPVPIGQHPARLRRYDLMRLNLLDSVQLGGGEVFKHLGHVTAWKTVGLHWKHGSLVGQGVILCQEPKAPAAKKAAK